MREIKFRAIRKYSNTFVYGNLCILSDGDICIIPQSDIERDGHHVMLDMDDMPTFFDKDTLGQFTGLMDKNGKEIYDGDILWVTDDDGCTGQIDTGVGEVEFLEGLWYICGNVQNGLFDINKCRLIEVIGNIYENADLLDCEV